MPSLRACGQCIRRQYLHRTAPSPRSTRLLSTSNPLRNATNNNNPLKSGNANNNNPARGQDYANTRRSMVSSSAGIAACAIAMYGVIELDMFGLKAAEEQRNGKTTNGAMKLDGPEGFPPKETESGHSLIRLQGQDGINQVETGTSTIPHFPSTIRLPKSDSMDELSLKPSDEIPRHPTTEHEEYQLLGLGIRTVSFLRIQVYVVGLYVATTDISELQQRLIRTAVNPPDERGVIAEGPGANFATSLVPGERQQLKEMLLDADRGDAIWDAVLKKDGLRTAFRIVPTRNTDFLHLRDGWVRGITGRAQTANAKANATTSKPGAFEDDSFGDGLNSFKGLFGGGQRKSVPKGQTLLLMRSARGELDALFQPDASKPAHWLGRVSDERISRLVWLNYLAGKNVSSEAARRSVVDGVMGIVERPVGTVVQKII